MASKTVNPATTAKAPKANGKARTPNRTTEPVDLAALATRIAKATRIKDVTVIVVQNGKAAVVVVDSRKLAYVRGRPDRISLVVCHYGREERGSYETVAAAAAAVKRSERLKPKAKPEPKKPVTS